ncbi:uncharacterized protein K02A2.6-like [Topomyia yanbarensis]|uniref:uncharacterized protein K02A2.6-like n=1 Tax=Topomyia yanbarensis TaxID=2498891 RepID=UPI00273BC313|nr:uncharacterized protein K02A2.6-like [Topomyia yanbarensis]
MYSTPTKAIDAALNKLPLHQYVQMEAKKSALRLRRNNNFLEGNLFGHLSILKDFFMNPLVAMNEDWMEKSLNLDIPYQVVEMDRRTWEIGGSNILPGSINFYTDGSKMNDSTGAGVTGPGLDVSIPMGRWTTVFLAEIYAILECASCNDASAMPPFKISSDPRGDWLKWKRAFERFLKANSIQEDTEKYDLLLVLGGLELQSYYDKVFRWEVQTPAVDGSGELVLVKYDSGIMSLEKYFAPQSKKRFERHLLRAMKQEELEPFEEYVFRVQDQANRCAFTDIDDMIVDQIIEGCKSSDLRKRLLTEDTTLRDLITLGKTLEEVQRQTRQYERHPTTICEMPIVQRITDQKSRAPNSDQKSSKKCYNCNRYGHFARETEKCAARDFACFNCGTKGHFKVCCRKRKKNETDFHKPSAQPKRVLAITENHENNKAVFFVEDKELNEVLHMKIGGVEVALLIDSGSPANIINAQTFEFIKNNKAHILNERIPDRDDMRLKPFASDENIAFSHVFEAEIMIPGADSGIWSHILVAPLGQTNLLSKSTAFALGVLKIGYNINQISQENPVDNLSEFPKVPNVTLKIQVDGNVQPIAQAARRFPIAMEADVETEIQELLQKNIIERAEGPLTWVSPLVPIRKSNGRLRMCVDMRAVNRAVRRENYPIPNIDAAIASVRKVSKLSKIDLETAYYHFELDRESRNVTTFVARSGVYRFCRLMFGIKSAPELFQREMENLFRGINGLIVYMDDLLIYGATDEEHDQTLKEVLDRLQQMNMKVNEQKSQFGVREVIFLGHHVSTEVIRPTDEKIRAILDLQPPSSMTELRSLLGLINFVGKFVPNLASITRHMRSLLLKESSFVLSQVLEISEAEPDVIAWLAEEVRPCAISVEELEEASIVDEELQKVKAAIYSADWEEVSREYKTATIKEDLSLFGELILRGDRIVVPKALRE